MKCTTLEQSKKLLELGIDPNTADVLYTYDFVVDDINGINIIADNFKPEEKDIPAWSLAALLELLDDTITDENGNDYFLEMHKEDGEYYLLYHDRWGYIDDIESDYHDDMIDACVELIVKLKEKNLL